MNRRQFLASASTAALVLPFHRTLLQRDDAAFTPLRRGVGTFVARGGTVGWLAAPDALVVVDTQFPDTAEQLWTGLQERSPRTIDLLINTHHHGDHTAGNAFLRPHAERLLAHENVPALQRAAARRQAEQGQTPPEPVTAEATYGQTWRQDAGDETVSLRYFGPAHTGGDSVVHFEKADVVHMGDLVFNRLPAFIDRPGGASTRGWIEVLEQVHDTFSDDTLFIFGHGNAAYGITGRRADLLVMRDFLNGHIEYVRKAIAEGKTLDEMAAIDRLPGFPDHYNPDRQDALARGIRTVHAELTEE